MDMTTKTDSTLRLGIDDVSLSAKYLQLIRQVLEHELTACRCKVYVFGSRAEKTARPASDIDLAIDTAESVKSQLVRIQAAFEESEMPFTVDIIDLKSASPALKQAITQRGKLIWQS